MGVFGGGEKTSGVCSKLQIALRPSFEFFFRVGWALARLIMEGCALGSSGRYSFFDIPRMADCNYYFFGLVVHFCPDLTNIRFS